MEPRSDRRNEIIAGIIIIAIIIIGVAYLASKSSPQLPESATTTTSTASSTDMSATSTGGIVSINGSGTSSADYTVNMVSAGTAPAAPNYKAPLTFSASAGLTSDEEASMQAQFAQAEATLAKTPSDFNSWIELGDLRKQAGDYAGAAADFQYMSKLYPTNPVSNANLGDLYTNYLHEYPQAAIALKAQIAIVPTDVYIYDDLFQLYTNQYPQSTAVITAMLKAGIAANPNAAELKADLAKYQ